MKETSPQFHLLLCAISGAYSLIKDLPEHSIPNENCDLLLRSYNFLCHAAIEEYLEKFSSYLLNSSILEAKNGLITDPLVSACFFYKISLAEVFQDRHSNPFLDVTIKKSVSEVSSKHAQAVYENNGIRTKDQDSLFLPVGFRIFDVDRLLSQALDSFGANRGKIAHNYRITTKVPKAGAVNNIKYILIMIQNFDSEVCRQSLFKYSFCNQSP